MLRTNTLNIIGDSPKSESELGPGGHLGSKCQLQAPNHTSYPPNCLYHLISPESRSRARIELEWFSGSMHLSGSVGSVWLFCLSWHSRIRRGAE
uniref:Uncharacterized protein n=1 Tax=Cucumis sativus TaxID=3659 RepID=A0A0A0LFA8_CUCSA